jgi:microcompartment protein CcmK/EutM
VFYVESGDATATGPGEEKVPSDAAVVGLVDTISLRLDLYRE